MEARFGFPDGASTGAMSAFADRVHPADRASVQRAVEIALERREAFDIDFRVQLPEGGIRWVNCKGAAAYDVVGNPERVYGVNVDVTERKAAEKALREADRRKNEFLATLAHELRNPLVPIRNAVEIMRHQIARDPTVHRACDLLDRQVQHLVRLIDDLLDVSRISRGKLQLRRERTALSAVLDQALEIARPLVWNWGPRGGDRVRRRGGLRGSGAVAPRPGVARPWNAPARRLRSLPAHSRAGLGQRPDRHRTDWVGAGWRSPPDRGSGI